MRRFPLRMKNSSSSCSCLCHASVPWTLATLMYASSTSATMRGDHNSVRDAAISCGDAILTMCTPQEAEPDFRDLTLDVSASFSRGASSFAYHSGPAIGYPCCSDQE